MNTRRKTVILTGLAILVAVFNAGCCSHRRHCYAGNSLRVVPPMSEFPALPSFEQMNRSETAIGAPILNAQQTSKRIYEIEGKINRLRHEVDELRTKLPGDIGGNAPG